MHRLVVFFLALIATSHFVLASPAPLTPEAQADVGQGIEAAKTADYLSAIAHFQDARRLAPEAPTVLFNLGLAESKIPGRELRAIAWFGAYLTALPQSGNAAAVRDQITKLRETSDSNISQLIQLYESAVVQADRRWKDNGLKQAAYMWALIRDYDAAWRADDKIEDPKWRDAVRLFIISAQAMKGDIDVALRSLDRVETQIVRDGALLQIATSCFDYGYGDMTKALAIARKIQSPKSRAEAEEDLAKSEADAKTAKTAETEKTAQTVEEWTELLDGELNSELYLDMAGRLKRYRTGDPDTYLRAVEDDTFKVINGGRLSIDSKLKRLPGM